MPQDVDVSRLPREVRAELRSLSPEGAEFVSKHLLAAGDLVDSDPALALRHAQAAKRRGARLPLVREALAETAYAADEFAIALNEYRALRRMTGDTSYFPVMADCERALGKPEEAVRLIREAKLVDMNQRTRIELVIVEAGAREDLGQAREGKRTLKVALGQVTRDTPHEAHARLAYAYAAMLLRQGQEDQAREWFETADLLDVSRELDAGDQLELLDGVEFEFDFAEDDESDQDDEHDEDHAVQVPPVVGSDAVMKASQAADAEPDPADAATEPAGPSDLPEDQGAPSGESETDPGARKDRDPDD